MSTLAVKVVYRDRRISNYEEISKNGMLCTESGVYEADLLIEDDVIREIGTGLADEEAEVVDASGRYVLRVL